MKTKSTTAKKKNQSRNKPTSLARRESKDLILNVPTTPIEQGLVRHTPDMLLAMGIEKGMSMEQLEKLTTLMERWLDRQAKSAFLQAKTDFQSELPELIKNRRVYFDGKTGPVEYWYSELNYLAQQIQPHLKRTKLSYSWAYEDGVDKNGKPVIRCTCIVSHVGGHTESTTLEANHDPSGSKNEVQARGSTVAYLERYTLRGALGLSSMNTDTDGRLPKQKEEPKEKKKEEVKTAPPVDKPFIGEKQLNRVIDRINAGEDIAPTCKQQFTLTDKQLGAINAADQRRIKKQLEKEQ